MSASYRRMKKNWIYSVYPVAVFISLKTSFGCVSANCNLTEDNAASITSWYVLKFQLDTNNMPLNRKWLS